MAIMSFIRNLFGAKEQRQRDESQVVGESSSSKKVVEKGRIFRVVNDFYCGGVQPAKGVFEEVKQFIDERKKPRVQSIVSLIANGETVSAGVSASVYILNEGEDDTRFIQCRFAEGGWGWRNDVKCTAGEPFKHWDREFYSRCPYSDRGWEPKLGKVVGTEE